MKLIVAGQDRTQDLGQVLRRQAEIITRAEAGRKPAGITPEISALALAQAKSDAGYLDQLVRLLRYRDAVDTLDFDIPRKPGVAGLFMARIKAFLWKLLRYQHDRIVFRQNMINGLHTSALEYEIALRQQAVADLDQRLKRLESQLAPGTASQPQASPGKPS